MVDLPKFCVSREMIVLTNSDYIRLSVHELNELMKHHRLIAIPELMLTEGLWLVVPKVDTVTEGYHGS